MDLTLHTSSLPHAVPDAALEKAQAAGAEVVQEPMLQPHGVRDRAVCDPAGDLIRIQQPRPDAE